MIRFDADADADEDEIEDLEMALLDECVCEGEYPDFHYKDGEIITKEIENTDDLKAFIMNDNEAWLEDNRNARPTIRCTRDCENGQYTFTISFCRCHGEAPKVLRQTGPDKNKDAVKYIRNRGILKLKKEWNRTVEVGVNLFFQTGKVSRTTGHIIEGSARHEIFFTTRDDDDLE